MSEHFARPKLYDISETLSEQTPVFPGDQAFQRRVSRKIENQSRYELSAILTTLHIGAHADAPSHYAAGAPSIENRSLELYLGDCQVVAVNKSAGERIEPQDVREIHSGIRRVLFKTCSYRHSKWSDDFNSLSPQLVHDLARRGVRLVGIDTPSVDPAGDPILESHLAIHQTDMAVLEGLNLQEVPEGIYTLMALPLKIERGEASPVRAVLYTQSGLFSW